MIVDEITVERKDQQCRLSARVELNRSRREFRLFYEYPLENAEWVQPCARKDSSQFIDGDRVWLVDILPHP